MSCGSEILSDRVVLERDQKLKQSRFELLENSTQIKVNQIFCGGFQISAITEDQELYSWGGSLNIKMLK